MPAKAPSLRKCGCIVPAGQRCAHAIAAHAAHKAHSDAKRPNARARGYSSAWEKARTGFLAKHPRCARCGSPATVVNHRIPHRGDRKLFWDRNNWEPVCAACHNGPIQSEERQQNRGAWIC